MRKSGLKHIAQMTFMLVAMITSMGIAQESNQDLGDEYFSKGDYEKARVFYEKALKKKPIEDRLYEQYYQTLLNLNDYKSLKKFLLTQARREPDEWAYRLDYSLVLQAEGNEKEFEKEKKKNIDEIKFNGLWVELSTRHLIKRRAFDYAEEIYLESRAVSGDPTLYGQNLLTLYQFSGKSKSLIDEGLNLVGYQPGFEAYVEGLFQDLIENKKIGDYLENQLVDYIQKNPGTLVYQKMLTWFYVQTKSFERAFRQAKSLDKRLNREGADLVDLGELFLKNDAYEEAIEVFEYVSEEYKGQPIYPKAKRLEITSREELVKSTFPVDTLQIRELLVEYKTFVTEVGKKRSTADALRRMGLLYAFQLNEYDTSISLLQEAIRVPRTPRLFAGSCKLDLGDIYLLKSEPWESKLLYAQVEKSFKDQPIGHEGKFRLARLYYFEGDIDLAKANLDILKRATTREISNDALDLALLIQDNTGLDTSYDAIIRFAEIDLLYFSNQLDAALMGFQSFNENFPNHSLNDEALWKQSLISEKMGNYEQSLSYLDRIIRDFGDDILMDDALYKKGIILEDRLERPEEALEVYKQILFEYPGSFYSEDARRRFRNLRGDSFN